MAARSYAAAASSVSGRREALTLARDRASLPRVSRTILLLTCLGGLTAGCLKVPGDFPDDPSERASAPTTVEEVLARHIEALGGEEKLKAIAQRTTEARMIFRADEGCEEDDETCMPEDETGSFILHSTADGRLYRRTLVGDMVEERGFDGKLGWALAGNGALRIDTEDEAALSREDAVLHWYFGLAERGIETRLLASRKEDSQGNVTVLDGIEMVIAQNAEPKQLWFDRATGLLREELVEQSEGEDLQRQVIAYDDYREIDGVMVAHHVRVTNQVGEVQRIVEFSTQRVSHESLDASKFAIPEVPKPDPQPDQLMGQLEDARAEARAAPKDASAQVDHARLAFANGLFSEAARAAEASLVLDSSEPEALYTLARVQLLTGDLRAAERTFGRAAKAGVRPEVIARQLAWVHHHRRDYSKLADAFDEAGTPVMAGRYRSFVGKPLVPAIDTNACVVSVPLTSNAPLAVIDLKVGDQTVGAIIDTGAADLILAESLANALDLTIRARSAVGGQGGPEVGHGQLDAMAIGGLKLANIPVNVFDDAAIAEMAGEKKPKKVQAVLGVGLLSDFQVTLDAPGETFELVAGGAKCRQERQSRQVGKAVPMWLHETHYIYLNAKMNGADGVYLVNTGMRGADMTAGQVAYAHAGIGIPAMRSDTAPMVEVEEFTIGDGFTANGLISAFGYFENTQSSDRFRIDGMLGLGVMGRQRFTIDFDGRRIWFSP
jgi:tetratricopeptide (TPR) repeat protein